MDDSFLSHLVEMGEDEYKIRMERQVVVKVAEARNLPKGVSGTWVEILVEDRSAGRTPIKYKEKNPFYGEDLMITLKDDDLILSVVLWKESSKKGPKKIQSELGRVLVKLDNTSPGDHWYTLESSKKGLKTNIDIRMAIIYYEITILPSHKYTKLLDIILDKKSDFRIIMLLATSGGVKAKDAADLAELLIQIGDCRGGIAPDVINALISHDVKISDCKETLFRGNSVGTKALDFYMKWVASRWLDCLRPLVQTIIASEWCCEVRETRLSPEEDWTQNAKNLEDLFDTTIKAIFSSVHQCPLPLRRIFYHIRTEVEKLYPDDPEVPYTAITGFLFLRFFVPAIMTPKLFKLAGDYSTGNAERTFTLVATVLQKLANLQTFEQHEAHFTALNSVLKREEPNMRKFVDYLSSSPHPDDPEAINMAIPVDLDLMVARLCKYLSDNLKPLENALSDKLVVIFLAELEVVFEEMKFLWKKFKNDQYKRIKASAQSCPATPTRERAALLRERTEPERVKRRHSFSLDKLGLVKSNSKESKRDKSLSLSESHSKVDLEGETEVSKESGTESN